MALDPVTELEGLVVAFDTANVAYAVCGGLALAVHGLPRATMDIDVLVVPEQLSDAIAVAKTCGFDVPARKMVFGLASGRHREVQRISKLDSTTGKLLSLDLIVVNDELTTVWKTRMRVDTGRRIVSVVSRDGLVTMKRIAGRPQDLLDIANLENAPNEDEEV
jgi:hypothetical protein